MAGPGQWRIEHVSEDAAEVASDGFGLLDVFRKPGNGEWSAEVVRVEPAAQRTPAISSLGSRGHFSVTGLVDWEFPSEWPADHDETRDGPRIPTLWSMTVGGIPFEIARDDAPGLEIRPGVWLRLEVSQLTLWWGEDEVVPFYREAGSRRIIQRIYDHLVSSGCRSMSVSREHGSADVWVLHVRPRDFERAAEIAACNV